MAATVQTIRVQTNEQMENAIRSYIVQGYVIANQTESATTMIKRKEFSVLWAVIGFVLCILPLLVYLIVYATQSDSVVEIVIAGGASPSKPAPPAPTL
ncbi:MAG TPA: hypothetical protein VG318_08950 [Actinomycetota bacterium]|nr:hypothetical protein [Actinomycetota bacterium]